MPGVIFDFEFLLIGGIALSNGKRASFPHFR